jgi:predicted  nucleic acid-binding Zn-ribbon protein
LTCAATAVLADDANCTTCNDLYYKTADKMCTLCTSVGANKYLRCAGSKESPVKVDVTVT